MTESLRITEAEAPREFDFAPVSILSPEAEAGMVLADENADARWKREIDACILAVAKRLSEFTVDDVLAELATVPNAFRTHNLSALGPRMIEVAKHLHYMTQTGRVQRSVRPEKHRRWLRVWQSNLRATS
jgi:hypothetical protein